MQPYSSTDGTKPTCLSSNSHSFDIEKFVPGECLQHVYSSSSRISRNVTRYDGGNKEEKAPDFPSPDRQNVASRRTANITPRRLLRHSRRCCPETAEFPA